MGDVRYETSALSEAKDKEVRESKEKVSQEELDGIIQIVDADGDGEIDLDEFKRVMRGETVADV